MAQQHRYQQEQENQRSRWREGNYGDRNEEDRTRWERDSDEHRWTQGGGQSRQGSYGRAQYGQRAQGGYGYSGGREFSQGRQDYGQQYPSQSFDQPYPPGFQDNYGAPQRAGSYGSGSAGSAGFGMHSGKGPKGYTRSDERLKEVICEKLTDDPDIDASEISVDVTGQIVKLTGTVDDRATKYEVEELIERCGGVKDIDNQLRVRSGASQGSGG
jgi:osmotically-inducible protein OsmY